MRDLDGTLAGPLAVPRERMHRKRFYRVHDGGEDPALYVKLFAAPRGLRRLPGLFRRSKALREARVAQQLTERGIAALEPLAVAEERRLGLPVRSVSVFPELPLRDLRSWLADPQTPSATRRDLVTSFGELNRRLHDAGVNQDDTSPNNFLVDPQRLDWVLIDFERCWPGRPLSRRRRSRLLAKLHRHDLGVSRSERLRFLRAYQGKGSRPETRRRDWTEIESAYYRVRKNDARRAARAAFQVGRNVACVDGVFSVAGRENSAAIRLHLDTAQCRAIWMLAHVFERLALPALRPVRMADHFVDLLAPELDENAREFHAAVARARSRFAPYGRWVRDPQWALTREGAVLLTPNAFKLKL